MNERVRVTERQVEAARQKLNLNKKASQREEGRGVGSERGREGG